MKKILLSVFAAILVCGTASAQGFGWGFKAGVNISNMSLTNLSLTSKAGFTGGIFIDYIGDSGVGFSADLLYSGEGAKLKAGGVTGTESSNYINIPILLNYYVGGSGFAIKAGIQPGFLMSVKTKYEGGGQSQSVDTKDEYKSADFSIPVGISYLFKAGIILDARYNIGVANVSAIDGIKGRNNYASITLGYRF